MNLSGTEWIDRAWWTDDVVWDCSAQVHADTPQSYRGGYALAVNVFAVNGVWWTDDAVWDRRKYKMLHPPSVVPKGLRFCG